MSKTLTPNTVQTFTVNAYTVRDLLTGCALAAHSKNDLRTINTVALSVAGGELRAVATDRYRLHAGIVRLDDEAAVLDQALIPLADIKKIIAALKALPKRSITTPAITFNRAGDILTVSLSTGDSFTVQLVDGNFPPYEHLIPSESVALEAITFNASYMADIGKIPTDSKQGQTTITFSGDRKPIKATVPHDLIEWTVLLMPMRVS